MDKPGPTIRLANILFLASGALFTLSPRIMAQTADTHRASNPTTWTQEANIERHSTYPSGRTAVDVSI